MPRPKILRDPTRIHLTLDRKIKEKARRIAAGSGISVAQFVSKLINNASHSEIYKS
jgi:hypothetical protein